VRIQTRTTKNFQRGQTRWDREGARIREAEEGSPKNGFGKEEEGVYESR